MDDPGCNATPRQDHPDFRLEFGALRAVGPGCVVPLAAFIMLAAGKQYPDEYH